MHWSRAIIPATLASLVLLSSCSTTPPYRYHYRPGISAIPAGDGKAQAPPTAPAAVHRAIAAGNRIAGLPYRHGGGHGRTIDSGYDCSGAVSHVLMAAGLLNGARPSSGFLDYGQPGAGRWITVYARKGHVFLVVADLRFDTGWTGRPQGPRWTRKSRPAKGYTLRHPAGW